ncbi:MAG: sulfite exporter TauE/SafE family protein [Bacillota bacterium]|nr:sulfite exporter TauE/SafE family protein [Bacillota bacterium]
MDNILLALTSAITGVLSGMGIGGGSLLIILLVSFFGFGQQKAQGINLLYFLPTAAAALFIHLKEHNIEKKTAALTAASGIITAYAASLIALRTDPALLRKIFALLVMITGISELLKKPD